ncbi:MAG: superinfection exclusion B family protein [Candidatus Omnitrophica bacterium]|nr:superinfection exclusion B family protein [Candidatus Omnitrophota bacterium]
MRRYVEGKTRTQYFQIEDGVIQGLVAVDVLYRSAQVGHLLSGFAYNIQPWAWEYLNRHPDLLSGPDVPLLGEGDEL